MKKDVQGPLETVQQNIRAKTLISKVLTNMFMILKRRSENTQWRSHAAFFLNYRMVIKIIVALFKELEVYFSRWLS